MLYVGVTIFQCVGWPVKMMQLIFCVFLTFGFVTNMILHCQAFTLPKKFILNEESKENGKHFTTQTFIRLITRYSLRGVSYKEE